LLSGDTADIAAPNAFQVQPGATYTERECDPRSIPVGDYSRDAVRPFTPSTDPLLADPRPYPSTIRDPYNRIDPYPTSHNYPYPPPTSARDPFVSSRYPPVTSRDPFPTRDYYPARDHSYGREPYPSRDPYVRDPYNRYPPGRDYNGIRDPYPSSPYPGGTQDPGSNYLDPELSPYRCRYTITYEKVLGHTYNGARK